MDFSEITNLVTGNPLIAVGAAIVLLILIYLKPKIFLTLLIIVVLLGVIFRFIIGTTSSVAPQKERMIEKGLTPQVPDSP